MTRSGLAYLAGSWLLIQIADTVLPAFGFPNSVLTILITILAVGFVPAMAIAWAFELTSDGLKIDDGNATRANARLTRFVDRGITVLLALAVGYFAADKFLLSEGPLSGVERTESPSIAVLAFDDLSPEGNNAFLADGIAEDILGLLTQSRNLRVSARSSSFSFKGQDASIGEIGEALGVDAVLEGSVSRVDRRLRVLVSLTDVETDSAIWSRTYNQQIDDVFDIQEQIAASVLFELEASVIGAGPTISRVEPQAYRLYLQGRELNHRNTPVDAAEAIPLLKQAVEIEPTYALAIAELARATHISGVRDVKRLEESRRTAEQVVELIERAVAADGEHPFVVAWQGFIETFYRQNLDAGIGHMHRALALGPNNYDAMRLAMAVYGRALRYEETIAIGERLLPRDPLCVMCHYLTAMSYAATERIDEAAASVDFVISRVPEGAFRRHAHVMKAMLHLLEGEPAAVLSLLDVAAVDPDMKTLLTILALHDLNRSLESQRNFEEVRERWSSDTDAFYPGVAAVYAWTGDSDQAFRWIEKDIETYERPNRWEQTYLTTFYRGLFGDPRWQQVMQKADARYMQTRGAGG